MTHPNAMTDQPKPVAAAKAPETVMERYARETRNGVVFIAWIVGIFTVASIVLGIIVGVQLAHVNSNLLNGSNGGGSSICESQGGSFPGC